MLTPFQLRRITRAAGKVAGLSARKRMTLAEQAKQVYTRHARAAMREVGGPAVPILKQTMRGGGQLGHVLSELAGKEATTFGRDVIRYARGGTASNFLGALFGQLGPAGKVMQMLLRGKALSGSGISNSAIRDAIKLLEGAGFEVRLPTEPARRQLPKRMPGFDRTSLRTGRPRTGAPGETPVEPEVEEQPPQTGAFPGRLYVGMERVTSSNVYAIGYDVETETMRVQYLGTALSGQNISGRGHKGRKRVRGKLGSTVTGKRSGPGPTYDYHGVPPRLFERIRSASSTGAAIWDHLRIRGTIYGHRFDYELVAASVADVVITERRVATVTYVPRKAVGPGQFQGRRMRQGVGRSARTFRSLLPNQGMRAR